ncbi:hypothetical protein [Bacillus sp. REN16]|uniref:hypothetical protein n=1 Tax=Bacillus sp. REN16 TaxID=2887296 RepID=UPI001E2A65E8|nr:hypothetical protein [Bacillus sp. REN16]MCC3356045.1 hypothetical protein [Bacillus sp. REN16]
MKQKIFWASISIIILSYFGNYFYFQSKQLDSPVFLEHFYELTLNEEDETTLTFYYLTNKSDTSTANFVMINGIETVPVSNHDFFMWDSQAPQYVQEFTHHYLKAVSVSFPTEYEGNEPLSFSEMEVHFSDGKTVQADIGGVILHKRGENPEVFDFRMGSSSNQHTSETLLVSKQPVTIEKIEIPFTENIPDNVLLKVDREQKNLRKLENPMEVSDYPEWFNHERDKEWSDLPGVLLRDDLLPFNLEQNEYIRFFMQFNPERDSYFQFSIKLIGQTESGEKFVSELPIMNHPYLDQKAINRIIKGKERDSK